MYFCQVRCFMLCSKNEFISMKVMLTIFICGCTSATIKRIFFYYCVLNVSFFFFRFFYERSFFTNLYHHIMPQGNHFRFVLLKYDIMQRNERVLLIMAIRWNNLKIMKNLKRIFVFHYSINMKRKQTLRREYKILI